MNVKRSNIIKAKKQFNREGVITYGFLSKMKYIDEYHSAEMRSCIIMIYKEMNELFCDSFLKDIDIKMIYYVMKETVEYLFDLTNLYDTLGFDLLSEMTHLIKEMIIYTEELEIYESSQNLNEFLKIFVIKNYNKVNAIK